MIAYHLNSLPLIPPRFSKALRLAYRSAAVIAAFSGTSGIGQAACDPIQPVSDLTAQRSPLTLEKAENPLPLPQENFSIPYPRNDSPDSSGEDIPIQLKKIDITPRNTQNAELEQLQKELDQLVEPFLNRSIRLQDLEELRTGITLCYVKLGYINSGATIPPQQVNNGVLSVHVTEGILSDVIVSPDDKNAAIHLDESYVRNRLLANAGTPLQLSKLQNAYQLLLRDPIITQLNGKLLPGKQPGDSILQVRAKSRPYQIYARADNYATPLVGEFAGHIGGQLDSLTPYHEHLDADFYGTDGAGSLGFNTGMDLPLQPLFSAAPSNDDTHVSFRYSDNDTALIEKPSNSLNIKTRITNYEGGLYHRFFQNINRVAPNVSSGYFKL